MKQKRGRRRKHFFVDYQLFTYYKGVLKESGIKQKPSFTHQGVYYLYGTSMLTVQQSRLPIFQKILLIKGLLGGWM